MSCGWVGGGSGPEGGEIPAWLGGGGLAQVVGSILEGGGGPGPIRGRGGVFHDDDTYMTPKGRPGLQPGSAQKHLSC